MQFTRLTPVQRDEMRAFIAGVHYAIPPSPTLLSREERRESGDDLFFSRVAGSILGNGSPATKDIARSLLQESQEGMGGRVVKAKKNVVEKKKVIAKMYAAAEKIEAATKMILEAGQKK
ncbi:hypothetical protein T069G_08796 [Trichoderma breve]|uniref:Uncharacterized protein n=1 Tax=Trichoderma breve TaxID=2034170 RepID=A0A9W9E4I9_9HYPO|nr:hypothetical protein T069G_08796 [Trichoderma breve]KAJ4857899.1 hypothetical protein T069G_08796 [Trichoderma breve]